MTHAKPTKQNKMCSCGHHHRETAYPLCCEAWLTVGTCPACGSTHVAFEGKPAHLLPFVAADCFVRIVSAFDARRDVPRSCASRADPAD